MSWDGPEDSMNSAASTDPRFSADQATLHSENFAETFCHGFSEQFLACVIEAREFQRLKKLLRPRRLPKSDSRPLKIRGVARALNIDPQGRFARKPFNYSLLFRLGLSIWFQNYLPSLT
jgi:hypothetical protein